MKTKVQVSWARNILLYIYNKCSCALGFKLFIFYDRVKPDCAFYCETALDATTKRRDASVTLSKEAFDFQHSHVCCALTETQLWLQGGAVSRRRDPLPHVLSGPCDAEVNRVLAKSQGRWTGRSWRSSGLMWSVWTCLHMLRWIPPRSFVQSSPSSANRRKHVRGHDLYTRSINKVVVALYMVSVIAFRQMVKSECEISWIIRKACNPVGNR